MFDRLIYENAVRAAIDVAVAANGTELHNWELRKAAYLVEAEIARASNLKTPGSWAVPAKPQPPALKLTVEAPPWQEGADQGAIKTKVGPDRVADPTCELPPLPGPNPPGVTDVGPWNWGDIWGPGEKDTRPSGFRLLWPQCKTPGRDTLERVGPSPWGRGFYREIEPGS